MRRDDLIRASPRRASPRRASPRRAAIVLGVFFLSTHAVAGGAGTLRECAARATAVGLKALEDECPQLPGALAELKLIDTLDAAGPRLTAHSLLDLAALYERYQGRPPTGVPAADAVRGIVDALTREQGYKPQSWWDALKAWLQSLFPNRDVASPFWLTQWFRRLADAAGVLQVVVFGLLVSVLAIAAAWLLSRMTPRLAAGRLRRSAALVPRLSQAASLTVLDRASPLDKPAILLRLLVDSLSKKGRLDADRHLTHRELGLQARLDDVSQRERFRNVAVLAEEVLYGPQPPSMEDATRAIGEGRELLLQIEGSGSATP